MAFEHESQTTSRPGLVLGLALIAAVALTAIQSSCQNRTTTTTDADTSSPALPSSSSQLKASNGARVTYTVTADGQIASVSYTNGDGDIATDTGVGTGWTGSARMASPVTPVQLTAVAGTGTRVLRCAISAGGRVVQESKAVGSPTVVCSASVSTSASDG